jgi:hypothetical protein
VTDKIVAFVDGGQVPAQQSFATGRAGALSLVVIGAMPGIEPRSTDRSSKLAGQRRYLLQEGVGQGRMSDHVFARAVSAS